MIDSPRHDEEQIREAVQVTEKHGIGRGRERHDPALRPAAHGARHVKRGAGRRPTGYNEVLQRRQLRLESVDHALQPCHVVVVERGLDDATGDFVGWIRELSAKREQIALNADNFGGQLLVDARRAREPEPRVELIDLAVGVHASIVLLHAGAIEQRCFASVARAGVDFHRSELYEMGVTRRRTETKTQPGHLPLPPERRRFRSRLLAWYKRHGRDLPWRKTEDPYHILVSEIMLQQTQVDRVLPKYVEWLEKYPSLDALAAAPEAEVTRTWYPLGYNIRPQRLQAIAREAVARYGSQLPADEKTLLSFKGIGAYTAGALRSFAFRERAAILDTNVARVLFRVFVGKGNPKGHAMKRHLWALSEVLVPNREVFDFNQALMDFGAMVCVARNPKCLVCPMAKGCRAFPFNPDHERAT